MKPIPVEVGNHLRLLIVPESDAHMDGHPVLTYSYAIFKATKKFIDADELLTPDKRSDPDYLGTLVFEQPGKLFSYEADCKEGLPGEIVRELISAITDHRENPNQWNI